MTLPTRRLRPARLLWLGWGLGALAVLAGSAVLVAERLEVPTSRSFGGTLRPDRDPLAVHLPAGVPLQAVVVEPGEVVRAGQTLALYDRDAIAAELARLEREVVVAGLRRDCLLSAASGDAAPAPAKVIRDGLAEDAGLDPETALQLRAALQDCRTRLAVRAAERDRLEAERARVAERHALVERKLALVLSRPRSADPRLTAEASVTLALERNQLAARLDTLAAEARALKLAHDRDRIDEVDTIAREVAAVMQAQARLAAALASPRLAAPGDGTVGRIRPIPAGQTMSRDEPLMDIRAPGAEAYVAEIAMTAAQASAIPPGTPVRLALLGFPTPRPVLTGTIEGFTSATSASGTTRVTARITLSPESLRTLANPAEGIALRGARTASTITVSLTPKSLANILEKTTNAILATRQEEG